MTGTEYQKINAPFKRNMSPGPDKGKLILGDWALPEFAYLAGNDWEFTEKVDGTNIRVHLMRHEDSLYVEFGGRTDTAQIPGPLLAYLESQFPQSFPEARGGDRGMLVGSWMVEHGLTDVILYGEGYGPKIQGGGKYRSDVSFVLFDVKIGGFWLDRDNVDDVADKLGIDSVPRLHHGTIWDAIAAVENGLRSQWGDFEAEGIVARPTIPLFNRKGERIITKVKAVDFRKV